MRFLDWIKQNDLTLWDAAAMLGSDASNVRRYAAGAQIPRPSLMREIFRATGGQVTPNDFYDLPDIGADQPAECEIAHTRPEKPQPRSVKAGDFEQAA